MVIRKLTGIWYLSKSSFGGFDVMVQVEIERWCDPSFGNGGGGFTPKKMEYQKATNNDLLELGINCSKPGKIT